MPNWTSTDLWCVVLYVTYSTTHQRLVEVQFGRYQKNILQESSMAKRLSCFSCGSLKRFPHTFTTSDTDISITSQFHEFFKSYFWRVFAIWPKFVVAWAARPARATPNFLLAKIRLQLSDNTATCCSLYSKLISCVHSSHNDQMKNTLFEKHNFFAFANFIL